MLTYQTDTVVPFDTACRCSPRRIAPCFSLARIMLFDWDTHRKRKKDTMRKALSIIAVTTLLGFITAPTIAQPGPANEPPAGNFGQPENDRSGDFSDATIKKFASALSDISEIQRELSSELQDVNDREQAMAMQREVQDEMVQAVMQHELSVETYNEVAAAMQQDVVLRNRILDLVGE